MTDLNSLPIGFFDSSMGGLALLGVLRELLPSENFCFLGDTARLPYGTKDPQTIERYALRSAKKLIEKHKVKMLVSCNSSSSMVLPFLRKNLPSVPMVGIVEPGAQVAAEASKNGRILVLASELSVTNKIYDRAIAARRPDAKVTSIPCHFFASLADEGWVEGQVAELAAKRYLDGVFADKENAPDTVFISCVHFFLLAKSIRRVLDKDVALVDGGKAIARTVIDELRANGLENGSSKPGTTRFMVTDNPARFSRIGGRFLGQSSELAEVELVDL